MSIMLWNYCSPRPLKGSTMMHSRFMEVSRFRGTVLHIACHVTYLSLSPRIDNYSLHFLGHSVAPWYEKYLLRLQGAEFESQLVSDFWRGIPCQSLGFIILACRGMCVQPCVCNVCVLMPAQMYSNGLVTHSLSSLPICLLLRRQTQVIINRCPFSCTLSSHP